MRLNFRRAKKRYNLCGKVQVHHIIPLQHRHHTSLENFDIDGRSNLMFLPIRQDTFNTQKRVHEGGHLNYNRYVLDRLNALDSEKNAHFLCQELRYRIRIGDKTLPWK